MQTSLFENIQPIEVRQPALRQTDVMRSAFVETHKWQEFHENGKLWQYVVMCRFYSQILNKMTELETIVGVKTKLNLGEKLNCSETHVLLEELKGNKYVDLIIKQKENLLIIIEKLNEAKKQSASSLNGGNGSVSLNYFAVEMIDLISNQILELDNKLSEIAELDSNYWVS